MVAILKLTRKKHFTGFILIKEDPFQDMYHLTVFILYRGLFYYYIYFNWGTLAIFQDEIKYIYTQELYCQTQVWHWRLKLGGKRYAIVFLTWTVHTFVGWLFSHSNPGVEFTFTLYWDHPLIRRELVHSAVEGEKRVRVMLAQHCHKVWPQLFYIVKTVWHGMCGV